LNFVGVLKNDNFSSDIPSTLLLEAPIFILSNSSAITELALLLDASLSCSCTERTTSNFSLLFSSSNDDLPSAKIATILPLRHQITLSLITSWT
jgi:hypothetical protein